MIFDNCTVITMDPERRIVTDAAVAVEGNSIVGVGKAADVRAAHPDDEIRDLHGWVLLPGMVDGHVHLPQQLMRGAGDDVPMWVWMVDRIFPQEGIFTPEDARVAARLAVLEMLKSGTTLFSETLVLGRHGLPALAETIDQMGIRAVLPRAVADGAGYLRESPLHEGLKEPADESIAETTREARRWRESERIHIWFGPRSTGGCSEQLLRTVVASARAEGIGIAHHYAMNAREVAYIREEFGCTPGEFLERIGMLGPDVVLSHCTAFDGDDIAIVRGTGTTVVHCPSAPAKVGSWLTPVPELLDAGVNVALGTDAAAANNKLDMIRDLRWVGYLQKLHHHDATLVPRESILEMATLGGARAFGLEHLIGSIEVGKRADFVVVRTDGVHWTPSFNPVSNLVYASGGSDVDLVVVDGRVLVDGGRLVAEDEAAILEDARERAANLLERSGVRIPEPWPIA